MADSRPERLERGGMEKARFGTEYFERLYGSAARQTWMDKVRDGRIVRIVDKHCVPGDSERNLLDIGCGYGYLLERFRDRFRLFGMDISEHGCRLTRDRLPGSQIRAGDVQQGISFPEKFHAILMINVVEHLADPRRGLTRVRDALQPGGICVVHLPTINNWFNAWVYSLTYSKDLTHVFKPSVRELFELFRDLGFERLAESHSPHYPRRLCNLIKLYPPYLAAFRRT